jgi:hypothetical protein
LYHFGCNYEKDKNILENDIDNNNIIIRSVKYMEEKEPKYLINNYEAYLSSKKKHLKSTAPGLSKAPLLNDNVVK